MCYYDDVRWPCGWWKWGNFRAHCNKEYRVGETCGLKLVFDTTWMLTACKLCENIRKKIGRIQKYDDNIKRWSGEEGRTASVQLAQGERDLAKAAYDKMMEEHEKRSNQVS